MPTTYDPFDIPRINYEKKLHTDSMKNFIKCGLIGWTMELFTTSLRRCYCEHDRRLMGNTSLLMFPIYGMAAALAPIHKVLCKQNVLVRGFIYMMLIFATEYTTGWLLRKFDMCPWDYSDATLNVDGLIRLDYGPWWFLAGLLFEQNVCKETKMARKNAKKGCAD